MDERRLYMEQLEQWEHEQEEFQRKRDAMGEAELRANFAEAGTRSSRDEILLGRNPLETRSSGHEILWRRDPLGTRSSRDDIPWLGPLGWDSLRP